MRTRCLNKNDRVYQHYGARGIGICERWSVFENFLADMGERPEGMSIDRIDNSRGYEPGNCRWATVKEQRVNQGRCRTLTVRGERILFAEAARRFGISQPTLWRRLARGMEPELALTAPVTARREAKKQS